MLASGIAPWPLNYLGDRCQKGVISEGAVSSVITSNTGRNISDYVAGPID